MYAAVSCSNGKKPEPDLSNHAPKIEHAHLPKIVSDVDMFNDGCDYEGYSAEYKSHVFSCPGALRGDKIHFYVKLHKSCKIQKRDYRLSIACNKGKPFVQKRKVNMHYSRR